jgi:CRP-like cAMP-binding protein
MTRRDEPATKPLDFRGVSLELSRVVRALRSVPLLAGLADQQLRTVATNGRRRSIRRYASRSRSTSSLGEARLMTAGTFPDRYQVLCREGAPAASFYILLTGRMAISSAACSETSHLTPTTCFAAECLCALAARTATATAEADCTLLEYVPHGAFEIRPFVSWLTLVSRRGLTHDGGHFTLSVGAGADTILTGILSHLPYMAGVGADKILTGILSRHTEKLLRRVNLFATLDRSELLQIASACVRWRTLLMRAPSDAWTDGGGRLD